MATKTEELIHSLQTEVTRVLILLDGLRTEVKDADLVELRVRLAELDSRLDLIDFPVLISQNRHASRTGLRTKEVA